MKKEEDEYVQVIFSQIEPYQDEPLAEDDSADEGNEVDEEADEDEDGDYSSPLRDRESNFSSFDCNHLKLLLSTIPPLKGSKKSLNLFFQSPPKFSIAA